jgi:hypothetical protein
MRSAPPLSARSREFPSANPADLERRLLRQLCHARLTRTAWARIARTLQSYGWRDVEHGLVYAAIERLGPCDPKALREQLPAEATRMGFPDIDWRAYFSAGAKGARLTARRRRRKTEGVRSRTAAASEIERLIRRLRKASA